ncbi:hypothetical protein HYU92_03090 [Candidatus Curtissbacteria bacterium]|nr:hypothetical protein [Candidatus Curtissbacteria bacterium]
MDINYTKKSDEFSQWIYSVGTLSNSTPKFIAPDIAIAGINSIYSLDSNLLLHKPIYFNVNFDGEDYYVEQNELELWARDKDLEKALANIKLQIALLYKKLKDVGENRLGPSAVKYWEFLRDYLENVR